MADALFDTEILTKRDGTKKVTVRETPGRDITVTRTKEVSVGEGLSTGWKIAAEVADIMLGGNGTRKVVTSREKIDY